MNLYNSWIEDNIPVDFDNVLMFLEDDEYNGIEAKKYIVAVVLIKLSFSKFNETKKVIMGGA